MGPLPLPVTVARRAAPALLAALAAALVLAPARASAALRHPVRGVSAPTAGPVHAAERLVLRLRPEVAHAALGEVRSPADRRALAARPPRALAALSARMGGAWFEPEFPGERPGSELAAFWIAHLPGGLGLAAALDRARGSFEVEEASPITIVPLDPVVETGSAPAAPGRAALPPWEDFASLAPGRPVPHVAAPDDTMWNLCYWLYQTSRRDLHVLEAWDVAQGDSSSIIAVIDTGVLRWHPDITGTTAGDWGNLWTNRAERAGVDGVDDDGNGYVDDVWGWDFVALDSAALARPGEDWRDADNDPNDFAVHGTAVAGVAAAMVNNARGTAGVAPRARIMAIRVGYSAPINPAGAVDLSWASQAIHYAVRNGATVISCSFASDQQPDLVAAVNAATAAGVLVVAAAGNNGTGHYLGDRDDVISVCASDQNDRITFFTNRGLWVDLAAPGQSIATTTLRATGTDSVGLRTPHYSSAEAGTSFAAPMVSAAAALLQQNRRDRGLPPLEPYLAQLRITETADFIGGILNPGTGYGSGRLNVQRVLTDPPLSTGFHAGAATIGPAVILPTLSGAANVAYATADSGLLLMKAVSGDTVARSPLPAMPEGGIAAADLGGGLGTGLFVALSNGQIAGFGAAGGVLPGWPVDATTTRGEFETMPALGDLDGDGILEVVWGGDDGSVWAWHADGSRVIGFPRRAGTAGRNLRVALGDLDGVSGLELVVASNNYTVYAFRGDGTPLPGWPVIIGDDPTAPVIMRLGSQTSPSVVVAGDTLLRAYAPNGTLRFRRGMPARVAQDLAVGDLNGDGRDEIAALMEAPDQLAVFDSAGIQIAWRLTGARSWGAPLIGPLASGSGAQVLFPSPDNQGRTRYFAYNFGAALPDLRGWPKAGHPSKQPSMGDVDGDGATELAAGSGADGLIYLYDAGPASWRPAAARWITARGNFARTGSRLDAPPLTPGDDRAPAAIADLASDEPGTHSVVLRWTAPADPGPLGRSLEYDLRMAPYPIDEGSFPLATPVPVGFAPGEPASAESLLVLMDESVERWFAIRSRDLAGNWSPISNVTQVQMPTEIPAAVSDLRVAASRDSALTFAWTATGDDGRIGRPARYEVRLSLTPMDSAAFANATLGADVPATSDAGGTESATIAGLPRGQRFHIGMRAVDAAGNVSGLSNAIASTVGRLARIGGVALLPARSPSGLPVEIEWQGDPAWSSSPQRIVLYDVNGRLQQRFALPAGSSGVVQWDGRTYDGRRVRPGIYFARLESGPHVARGRIVLIE